MVNPDRTKLSGEVEVNETWIGGRQAGLKGGRQRKDRKALLVAIAVERREKRLSPGKPVPKYRHYLARLRLEVVPDGSGATLGGLHRPQRRAGRHDHQRRVAELRRSGGDRLQPPLVLRGGDAACR